MIDGASNVTGHGIRESLMSPKNFYMPFTTKLFFTEPTISSNMKRESWESKQPLT